jgi:hypothetical protein
VDNARRAGNQSTRNTGANNNNNNGQPLQKICMRIQKETCKKSRNFPLKNARFFLS